MFRCIICALVFGAPMWGQGIRAWVDSHQSEVLKEFQHFLAIPNLASDAAGIRRNAETIRQMLALRGVQARLLEYTGAPPTVYGELRVPGASRTLAFYAHYDGQPVDPAQWKVTEPWKPVLRDGRIYGRSASDDKAAIVAMMAALDALKAGSVRLGSNIKFLFEGEEEAGSPHLGGVLRANADLLKADLWLICDGPVHQSGRQQVFFGARGITGLDITVYGATREVHSGHYGGWAPNAALMLTQMVASMRSEDGRVLVPGFYDDVLPLTALEKRAIAETPVVEDALRAELGLLRNENGSRSLSEIVNEPTLNVRGLRSVDVGKQARNVVPASATVSIDLRLVKGLDPTRAQARVIEHVRNQGYFVTEQEPDAAMRKQHARIARVQRSAGYPAAKTPMDLPVARWLVQAVARAAGPVVEAPTLGGSVPLYVFEQELRTPFIGLPIANHDNNQHSSDENLRLENLWKGIEVMAAVMSAR